MLRRDPIIDELFDILAKWTEDLDVKGVKGAYLFGSAVNEEGVRFESAQSDLDIVLILDWETLSLGERLDQLKKLKKAKGDLEAILFRKLERENGSDAIVSIVPVTLFEFRHAIHKDGVDTILKDTAAYDLLDRAMLEGLNGGVESEALPSPHRNSLQFVQKKRAEALSVTPNGKGGLKTQAHKDPVPKELMRHFAVATAKLKSTKDVADLARGLGEIRSFATEDADWIPERRSFANWLGVKQGDRGEVDPKITSEHYLMLVEAIFDRVHRQHPGLTTVEFNPPNKPSLPNTGVAAVSSAHRLGATFEVTLSDELGGTPELIARAIRAARANMKARLDKPFELRFEEDAQAEALIAAADDTLDEAQHRRKVEAFERRTIISARQARWQKGVELILWYGGTLFLGSNEVIESSCQIAIRNWFAIAAMRLVNPGGSYDGWHTILYPDHPMALRFSASGPNGEFLEPGRMASLEPNMLAGSFVPNLLAKYLHHLDGGKAYLTDQRDDIFNVQYWEYGIP